MCCSPGAANISKDDAPDWSTTQDRAERNISHPGPHTIGVGLSHQQIFLLTRDYPALSWTIRDKADPGHHPQEGDHSKDVEHKSPVVMKSDKTCEKCGEDRTKLAPCVDNGS